MSNEKRELGLGVIVTADCFSSSTFCPIPFCIIGLSAVHLKK